VEEVLQAVQKVAAAQGVEVVSTEALTAAEPGFFKRIINFLRDVRAEIGKVTWPSKDEIRKATTVIVIFVTALGLLIGLMDAILQFLLVRMPARIF
jgi:preprotein translocase subunit SecE